MADTYTADLPVTNSSDSPVSQSRQATPVCNPDGSFVGSGGGGGSTTANQGEPGETPWPVTGPLTNAQLTAVTGAANAASWSGTGNGTVIAILKALHAQQASMIALLETIATNTTPETP